jgi:hypothetical protein
MLCGDRRCAEWPFVRAVVARRSTVPRRFTRPDVAARQLRLVRVRTSSLSTWLCSSARASRAAARRQPLGRYRFRATDRPRTRPHHEGSPGGGLGVGRRAARRAWAARTRPPPVHSEHRWGTGPLSPRPTSVQRPELDRLLDDRGGQPGVSACGRASSLTSRASRRRPGPNTCNAALAPSLADLRNAMLVERSIPARAAASRLVSSPVMILKQISCVRLLGRQEPPCAAPRRNRYGHERSFRSRPQTSPDAGHFAEDPVAPSQTH